jgi:4'-phosphopantetheinyl transferase
VEAWAVWLDASETANRKFRSLLSPEEVLRAVRFATEALTASYQTSHGVLRVLLSRYLKRDPRELEFILGPTGKPTLKSNFEMHFNMSHSGGLAAYAFAPVCPVGVDIEEVRTISEFEAIAKHHFCGAETTELLSIADEKQRRDAFFRCWTRKESYIKAIGQGMSVPLDQFQVTLLPGVPARVVHIGNSLHAASAWTLHHIEPAPRYVGAVACREGAHYFKMHPPLHAQDILDMLFG